MKSEIDLDRQPGLRPPQFGLRTLMVLVTFSGLFCALSQWVSPWAMLGVMLLVLSIVAHVAGNTIGTRLRANGDRPLRSRGSFASSAEPLPCAPATHLSERKTLGWPIVIATFCGLIAGGSGGGIWTVITLHGATEPAAVAVGVIAFAILGGMAAFATAAFSLVLGGAIWQARGIRPASQPACVPKSKTSPTNARPRSNLVDDPPHRPARAAGVSR